MKKKSILYKQKNSIKKTKKKPIEDNFFLFGCVLAQLLLLNSQSNWERKRGQRGQRGREKAGHWGPPQCIWRNWPGGSKQSPNGTLCFFSASLHLRPRGQWPIYCLFHPRDLDGGTSWGYSRPDWCLLPPVLQGSSGSGTKAKAAKKEKKKKNLMKKKKKT